MLLVPKTLKRLKRQIIGGKKKVCQDRAIFQNMQRRNTVKTGQFWKTTDISRMMGKTIKESVEYSMIKWKECSTKT